MEPVTARITVLMVVGFLGAFALLGLGGLVFLIDRGTDAALIAVVAGPMGMALGGLSALLSSTRTAPPPGRPNG